jgi:HSP90 family molecular chaperone
VKKYSEFIQYPIKLFVSKEVRKQVDEDEEEKKVEDQEEDIEKIEDDDAEIKDEGEEEDKPEKKTKTVTE